MRLRNNRLSFLAIILLLCMYLVISCDSGNGSGTDVETTDNVIIRIDIDNDGYDTTVDCDDGNGNIHPGANDTMGDGVDSNCDGIGGDIDSDGDGFSYSEGDCNDSDASINPRAREICDDGLDQNCNGSDLICNEVGSADEDSDFDGYSPNDGDCNDADPNINPGEEDICGDGIDQDCSGSDASCDGDGDGFSIDEDCDDNDPTIHPGAAEDCNDTIDKNCDGLIYECEVDLDGDGYSIADGDCNDLNPNISPNAIEGVDGIGGRSNCADGIDNNCNSIIDLQEASCNEPVIGTVTPASSDCIAGVNANGEAKSICNKYDLSFSPSTISIGTGGATRSLFDYWLVTYREYSVTSVVEGSSSYFLVEWNGIEAYHRFDERAPYSIATPYAYPDYYYDTNSDGVLEPMKYNCSLNPQWQSGSLLYLVCYSPHTLTLYADTSIDPDGIQNYFIPYSYHVKTTDDIGRYDDAAGFFGGEY